MRGRIVAAFFAGMLFCALMLGAGFGAFYALSDDAQAQSEGTWQVADAVEYTGEFRAWVTTMSADCDIQTAQVFNDSTDGLEIQPYYRCPSD